MAGLRFRVEMVFPDLDGFDGVLLIGPPLNDEDLAEGESVEVVTSNGTLTGVVSGFPLIRLDAEKSGWVRMTVTGIGVDVVQVGDLIQS